MANREYEAIIIDARERFAVRWERMREFTRNLLRREVEYTDIDEEVLIDEMQEHFQLPRDRVMRAVSECELEVERELADA